MTEYTKYQMLDDAICAHIAKGYGHPTNSSALETIARPLLASNNRPSPGVAWRLIDRRMQAMRKAGRLVYERTKAGGGHGRWRVGEASNSLGHQGGADEA